MMAMAGAMAVQTGMQVLQGYYQYKQGKKILASGRKIRDMYRGFADKNKGMFEDSLESGKKASQDLRDNQTEQATTQYNFNREEIKRALEKNLRGAMATYVANLNGLETEIQQVKSQLAFANEVKGVENSESSIKKDMQSKLEMQAEENARVIIQNNKNSLDEITHSSNMENYQIGLNYNQTREQINRNYLSSLSQYERQFQNDIGQLINFENAGVNQAQTLINQGKSVKANAMQNLLQTALNTGIKAMGGASGISSMLSNFGKASNSGAVREVAGTYGISDIQTKINNADAFERRLLWTY